MELSLVQATLQSGSLASSLKRNPPEFKLVKGSPPPTLLPKAIEQAVWSFIAEVDVKGDTIGFFNQTIKTIASATILGGTNDFWMAEEDGVVMAYATGHFCNDIDDRLTYSVPQAWIHPRYRHHPVFRSWWNAIRAHAKRGMAQHLTITAARNPKAFARLLGNRMHEYAVVLKEDF